MHEDVDNSLTVTLIHAVPPPCQLQADKIIICSSHNCQISHTCVCPNPVDRVEPAVKKAVGACRPAYTPVPFSRGGFEGQTITDEEVAALAANADESDASLEEDERVDDDEGEVVRTAAIRPAQARVRNCRRRGRWVAC